MRAHGTPSSGPQELLARLIAFDTTSAKSNLDLIDFVREYLATHDVACELVPSEDGGKASLFATIGPGGASGIGLSGHTDVVPIAGQAWTSDPFTLTERAGRLYGRGACDMKGFLACVLAAVPDLERRKLKVPIHILFSYDEEVGCTGVRPMIAEFGTRLVRPRLVIVGEPTSMRVVDAHKGPIRYKVEVTGRAAHSSMAHLGVNAIAAASRLLAELHTIEAELQEAMRDHRFTPPYTSLQVTTIEGGSAANIVPNSVRFGWEMRTLPGFDVVPIEHRLRKLAETELLPRMRKVAPEADIVITRTNRVPAFLAGKGSEATSLALRLAGENATHAVSYGTEAGLFQEAGAPSIICGPGDIAQAHAADEFIAPDQLVDCMAFLGRLADWSGN